MVQARKEYWNGGYALLSGVIETASGQSFEEFCEEHLFAPAGMESTGFTGSLELPMERQAIGYDGEKALRYASGHPYGSYGYQYRGMGGIVTSAEDLLQFAMALEAGKILKLKTVKAMEKPVVANQGLGWGLSETKRGTRRVGHGGDVAGFHTRFLRFPDDDLVVVVLSNVNGIPTHPIAGNLEALYFGSPPPYPMPPAKVELEDEQLLAWVGEYVLDGWNGEERIVVERDGNGLRIGAIGQVATEAFSDGPPIGTLPTPSPSEKLTVEKGLKYQIKLAQKVLSSVQEKDAVWVRDHMQERIPTTWPTVLVDRIWPGHLGAYGILDEVETLGAKKLGPQAVEVVLGLTHEKGDCQLKIILNNDLLGYFAIQNGSVDTKSMKAEIRLAQRVLQSVRDGEADWVESILMEGIPGSWAGRVIRDHWPAHLKENGPLETVQVMGAKRLGPARVEVLLGLNHKLGRQGLKVIFQGGKLNIFDLNGPKLAEERRFVPSSPSSFVTFDWLSTFLGYRAQFKEGRYNTASLVLTGMGGNGTRFVRRE